MPRYSIIFPVEEFEAVHARQAKLDALEYFKKNPLKITWVELDD